MNKVQCKNCGLLAIRNREADTLDEVEPDLREQWRIPTPPSFLGGELKACPSCSAGVTTFKDEIQLALFSSANQKVNKVSMLEALITQILAKKRPCGSFIKWRQGFSPREHKRGELASRGKVLKDENRLVFDAYTLTVTLDGKPYDNLDPTAFALLEAINSGQSRPVSSSELKKRPGLKGKNIPRELRKLPPELQAIIKGESGSGRWICLL